MKGPKSAPVGAAGDGATAPTPRRTSKPKWLDIRVIGGLLLVVAAVVVGAKVVGDSARTAPVWAAARDLAAGTVLTAADLTPVEVNLADTATRYLSADPAAVVGRSLSVGVRAGELMPLSAIVDQGSGRVMVIGVTPERMPPGVSRGSQIDLYLTVEPIGGAAEPKTDRIAAALTVQSVTAPASGGLSGAGSNRYQVAVLLDAPSADRLVRELPRGEPVLTLVAGR